MKFRVIRPFNLNGIVRMSGQILEMDINQAGRFRRLGLIGLIAPERAVILPQEQAVRKRGERAVRPPGETRRGRKPKEQEIVPPGPTEESVENGAETGNGTSD